MFEQKQNVAKKSGMDFPANNAQLPTTLGWAGMFEKNECG